MSSHDLQLICHHIRAYDQGGKRHQPARTELVCECKGNDPKDLVQSAATWLTDYAQDCAQQLFNQKSASAWEWSE